MKNFAAIFSIFAFMLLITDTRANAIDFAVGMLRGQKATLRDGKTFLERNAQLEYEKKYSQILGITRKDLSGNLLFEKGESVGRVEAAEMQKNGDIVYQELFTSAFPHSDRDVKVSITKDGELYQVDRHFTIKENNLPVNTVSYVEKFSVFKAGHKVYKKVDSIKYSSNRDITAVENLNTSINISYKINGDSHSLAIPQEKIDTGTIQILDTILTPASGIKDSYLIRYLKDGKIYEKPVVVSVVKGQKQDLVAVSHIGTSRALSANELIKSGLLASEKIIYSRSPAVGNAPVIPIKNSGATK